MDIFRHLFAEVCVYKHYNFSEILHVDGRIQTLPLHITDQYS